MYEYPFGNGQQLNLDWFLAEWKNLLAAWEAEKNGIDGALQAEIDRAEAALADVFAARDAAAQSASNADASERAAAQSAQDASGYLSTVQQNATAAQDAARNAAQSESDAADSAQTALASKNAAGQSERNAAQSEANALASKDAAAQSAADALANKDAAAQSASDAADSADAAAQSASVVTSLASILDSFPSRVTPLSKAITLSRQNITIANGFITLSTGNGSSTVLDIFEPLTLPAGTYKLIIDLIDITQFSFTSRIGYFGVRINNTTYSPRLDIFHDTKIGKYEYTFAITETSTVEVITNIAYGGSETVTVKGFAYLDLGAPTTALGLALSN